MQHQTAQHDISTNAIITILYSDYYAHQQNMYLQRYTLLLKAPELSTSDRKTVGIFYCPRVQVLINRIMFHNWLWWYLKRLIIQENNTSAFMEAFFFFFFFKQKYKYWPEAKLQGPWKCLKVMSHPLINDLKCISLTKVVFFCLKDCAFKHQILRVIFPKVFRV